MSFENYGKKIDKEIETIPTILNKILMEAIRCFWKKMIEIEEKGTLSTLIISQTLTT